MSGSTVTIRGLAQAARDTQYAVHQGILAGLDMLGAEGVREVVAFTEKPINGLPPAVASGNFVNSIDFEVTPGAMASQLLVFAGAPADVYADPLDGGSRPHMPPVDDLLPWVKQKFQVDDDKAALSIAWAVAKSIEKKGVQPRSMFEQAQVNIEPKAPSILERQIAVALRAAGLGGSYGAS